MCMDMSMNVRVLVCSSLSGDANQTVSANIGTPYDRSSSITLLDTMSASSYTASITIPYNISTIGIDTRPITVTVNYIISANISATNIGMADVTTAGLDCTVINNMTMIGNMSLTELIIAGASLTNITLNATCHFANITMGQIRAPLDVRNLSAIPRTLLQYQLQIATQTSHVNETSPSLQYVDLKSVQNDVVHPEPNTYYDAFTLMFNTTVKHGECIAHVPSTCLDGALCMMLALVFHSPPPVPQV